MCLSLIDKIKITQGKKFKKYKKYFLNNKLELKISKIVSMKDVFSATILSIIKAGRPPFKIRMTIRRSSNFQLQIVKFERLIG